MYYDHETKAIVLSVRELCAMALKGGSIDTRYPSASLYRRAEEGREVHDRVRAIREKETAAAPTAHPVRGSEMPAVTPPRPTYETEVALEYTTRCEDVTFTVSGRADGVLYDPIGASIVEEIKSVTGPAALYVHAPRERDLAQLSCYGYFLCAARGLDQITLRLTYARPGEEADGLYTDSVMTANQLEGVYTALLRMILPAARDRRERETTVRAVARKAVFPYPVIREAQEDMVRELWRDMRAGQTVFAQAPTGIGKTIATLYPAVRCLGEGRADKIFYLTAKNATRREAFGAMKKLAESGTPLRAAVITARESMCLCDSARLSGGRVTAYCRPDICPYARGYYDRIDSCIRELLDGGKSLFGGLDIRAAAKKWQVCPYELSLDLSEYCEVIICDYNYVFSPSVALRRYFADGIPHSNGHRYLFLVDEAHNLADRARDMYTGTLSLSVLQEVQDGLHAYEEQLSSMIFPDEDTYGEGNSRRKRLTAASFDDVIGILSRMAGLCAETMIVGADGVRRGVSLERNAPVELTEAVRLLTVTCDRFLRNETAHPLYRAVDTLTTALRSFRTAADYYDRHFVTFVEVEGEDVTARVVCMDPSGILRPLLSKAEARVLFSATLTPTDYFADILGGDRKSICVSFDSPFPTDHLCVAVADHISTRFEDRAASYRRIVSYIAAAASAKKGNYMVYFPSYKYLDQVYRIFAKKYPKVTAVVQHPHMTSAEREAFIDAFVHPTGKLQIGFCVLGGSFSEGVDLPGRSLIGTVIVGVGIPGLSNERNIMKEYYDEICDGNGYDYAYTYPGMNHVLQAAGRVIRRAEDYGVVVLLDDRYMGEPYLHLYPAHWANMAAAGDPTSLAAHLRSFWDTCPSEGSSEQPSEGHPAPPEKAT